MGQALNYLLSSMVGRFCVSARTEQELQEAGSRMEQEAFIIFFKHIFFFFFSPVTWLDTHYIKPIAHEDTRLKGEGCA